MPYRPHSAAAQRRAHHEIEWFFVTTLGGLWNTTFEETHRNSLVTQLRREEPIQDPATVKISRGEKLEG